MSRLLRTSLVLSLVVVVLPGTAAAHPSHPTGPGRDAISHTELFPGEGVEYEKRHPGHGEHLPPKEENVTLLGEARMNARVGPDEGPAPEPDPDQPPEAPTPDAQDGLTGRIADVAAYGEHAYLAAFREPVCAEGGVFVVDISDPSDPFELEDAFIPAAPGNFVGEGMQVIDVDTDTFTGQLLVHNNEICDLDGAPLDSGGISLWDVTDPSDPQPVAENFADETVVEADPEIPDDEGYTFNHTYHSMRAWQQGDRYYVVGVDNDDVYDVDIFDITDPSEPVLIAETGLPDFPEAEQEPPPNGNTSFHHDVMHYLVDGRSRLLVSYWDAGYLWLDVDDPSDPQFLDDTDFAEEEPFREELGLPPGTVPEGNAHQAELSPDGELFIAADEDFNPYRIIGGIADGPSFSATQGSDVPAVTSEDSLEGPTVFVGLACDEGDAVPASTEAGQIAVAARGVCAFTEKIGNIEAAGYEAMIVYNSDIEDCLSLLNMSIEGGIPALFVNRDIGLHMLGVEADDPCTTPNPAIGTAGADITIEASFDGWGYVHLYDAETMAELDQFAIPESLDEDYAEGFGDLSVHEVAMDPNRPGRAYLAYYSGGFRVLDYSREEGLVEVGAYIDEDGSNLWGVEFHELPDGRELVLASDRDFGLQIFDPAATDAEPAVRVSGSGRIETAVAVSQATFDDGEAAAVVLARADIEPDALAGAPLAVANDAPLLLTSSNSLVPATAEEIQRVLPDGATVHLLGGTGALDAGVEAAVEALGFDTVRIAGATRIETAIEIAGALGDPDDVLITTGYNFPDALAAGAAAAHVGGAVLLTTGDQPHPAVSAFLDSREGYVVHAVGGPAARAFPGAEAVVGPTREETAVAAAERFFDDPDVVGVARRDTFPDALAGGAHIARLGGPILLTPSSNLHPAPAAYLCGQELTTAFVYGGTAAIDASTFDAVASRVTGAGC